MSGLSAKLADLKIGTKIAAVIGILFLAIAVSGWLSVRGVNELHHAGDDLATNWLPSIQEAGYMRFALSRHRTLVARHGLSTEAEQKTSTEKDLEAIVARMLEHRKKYEPMISSPQERAVYEAFVRGWDAYLVASAEFLRLSNADDDKAAAASFFRSVPVFSATDKALGDIIDINEAGAAASSDSADRTKQSVVLTLAATIGISVAFALASVLFLISTVSKPIVAMTAAMKRLADKDLAVAIPAMGRKDEVGAMADAVQIFKDNMVRADKLEAEAAKETAAREARAAKIEKLTQAFDVGVRSVVANLSGSAEALQKSAASMTQTAQSTSQQATAVAAASEQASTNVQTVASSAEELSASIQEISRRVAESATISKSAVDQADRTTETVQGLVSVATKIGDVTKLINDIASQTNLLALNATIEAARAGEAGKGFAVVAAEVKGLATQTSRATDEISEQISAIQKASADTVKAIGDISGTIKTINEIAAAIAAAVEEQGAATQEIARNVQQASAGTSEVSSNIAGVTQAAADTGTAAGQVRDGSAAISGEAATLKREVDGFLDGVRAA